MDDSITGDQQILLDATSRFVDDTYPLHAVRDRTFDNAAFAADYLRRAGELGWFSMLVSEQAGGGSVSGSGVLDAALIAYRRGRGLQPGAFVGSNVAAYALAVAGSTAQQEAVLPSLLAGRASATWALGALAVHRTDEGIRAVSKAGAFRLSGAATFVHEATSAEWLLITARSDDGLSQFLVPRDTPGVAIVPLDGLDLSRRFAEVHFADVVAGPATLIGEPGRAADLVDRQLAIACVLTAAETVGAMDRDFETALQYAKNRIAFGRPIGSFQAVKHLLADTSLALEMSKATVRAAAVSLSGEDAYGLQTASVAKAFVADAGIDLAQNCFQVFGGIGYTWEHDQHLFLRRITTDAALFGDASWHRERLCHLAGI